jgi:hypothetical protein
MVLGKEDAPKVEEIYSRKLRSSTQQFDPHLSRQTPRFLRIVASPDVKASERMNGADDVAVFRWDKVEEYISSTADSAKITPGAVV